MGSASRFNCSLRRAAMRRKRKPIPEREMGWDPGLRVAGVKESRTRGSPWCRAGPPPPPVPCGLRRERPREGKGKGRGKVRARRKRKVTGRCGADGHHRRWRERVQGKGSEWRSASRRRQLQTRSLHPWRHANPPPPPPPGAPQDPPTTPTPTVANEEQPAWARASGPRKCFPASMDWRMASPPPPPTSPNFPPIFVVNRRKRSYAPDFLRKCSD